MTLSLRPDYSSGLRPMEKWSNSGIGWGNPHQQVLNVLEPAAMSPFYFYTSHGLQSQSMFPQQMRSAEKESALVQAFAQAKTDSGIDANNSINSLEHTMQLQYSSNTSSSMVESSTSDEECTAVEIRMNCISALGGGPVSPVVATVALDRTGTTGASLTHAHEDFYPIHHSGLVSPVLPPIDDWLRDAEAACTTAMASLKRRVEVVEAEGVMDQVQGRKVHKGERRSEKLAQSLFHYNSGGLTEGGLSPAVGGSPYDGMWLSTTAAFVQGGGNAGGGCASGVGMDSMRAISFRHASHPVPSLEEIARSRPKRRNVRISKDPQSVAARHRRERISDRMRVLQRLVPGGTKMDTASMLDEAIHYVKFLQLQLQTLEQMENDNNCDVQESFAHPQAAAGEAQLAGGQLARRPFDLNSCAAAFQGWPLSNNVYSNLQAACLQGRYSNRYS